MTSTLTNALIIVMAINVMLFLGQIAVLETNSEASIVYNCEGSMLGVFSSDGCAGTEYVLSDTDPSGVLPEVEGSVSPETGAVYTDPYTGIKGWLVDSTGLGYLINILSAPSNLLKAIGLPAAFSFAIGGLWYGVTLFLIIAFLFGRAA
jgi:hypothetical protein